MEKINSLNDTKNCAESIAKQSKKGDVLLISGALGTGKTTFCKFFVNYFLPNADVTSPTFNILHSYETKNFEIWHLDCYRIKNAQEMLQIGLNEKISKHITLIEWPENIKSYKIQGNLKKISIYIKNSTRYIDY